MVVAQAEPGTPMAGRAEVPEDQHPVERRVRQVGDDDRDHDRRRQVHGLKALAEHDEEEERQHARRQAIGVGRRQGNDLGRLVAPAS